jgi:hypothetical protein
MVTFSTIVITARLDRRDKGGRIPNAMRRGAVVYFNANDRRQ